ncbi:transcriptional repressor [bacterium]|nr:transcriptional repressor [bacterium]
MNRPTANGRGRTRQGGEPWIMKETGKRLKTSRQRELVLELLRRSDDHPTAELLFLRARERMPSISRGTVYRNLKILKKAGRIRELVIGTGVVRYDCDMREHYHITCERCGRIDNLPHVIPRISCGDIAACTGYQVYSHRLTVSGLCPVCFQQTCRGHGEEDGAAGDDHDIPEKRL